MREQLNLYTKANKVSDKYDRENMGWCKTGSREETCRSGGQEGADGHHH